MRAMETNGVLIVVAALTSAGAAPAGSPSGRTKAIAASDFLDSIGICSTFPDRGQPVVQQRLLRTRRERAPEPPQHEAGCEPGETGEHDPAGVADGLDESTGDERGAATDVVGERAGRHLGHDPDRRPHGEQHRDLRVGQARVREQQRVQRVDRHQVGQHRPSDDAPGQRPGRERESASKERHGPTVAPGCAGSPGFVGARI